MVRRRVTTKSRGVKRRRLSARRGKFRIRSRRGVHLTVKRRCYGGTVTVTNVTTADFWQYIEPTITGFSIFNDGVSGLTNIAEYQALFDQYKVNAVKIEFKPRVGALMAVQNPYGTPAVPFVERPYVAVGMDRMSTTIPTGTYGLGSYNFFCEQVSNVRTYRGDRPFTVYLNKPMCTEQYAAGATRYVRHTWTDLDDVTSTALKLRGFHIYGYNQAFNTTLNNQYDIFVTWYISFRGMK